VKPAPDQELRERALEPGRSFLVQAPAGSGKTELLTQRYLALLGRVERPEEILAVTFTRKAAAEMRDRVVRALRESGGEADPDSAHRARTQELALAALARSRELGWGLPENPTRLRVHTIDGFMASLVARMPWLSRLGPPPRIAERPEDLYEAAAEAVLSALEEGGDFSGALARVLDHLDNRASDLRSLLIDFLARRDQWLRHRPRLDPESVRPELEAALARAVARGLARAEAEVACVAAELVPLAAHAGERAPNGSPIARLAGLREVPSAAPRDLARWQGLVELLLTHAGTWRSPRGINKNLGFPPGGDSTAAKAGLGALLEALNPRESARLALAAVRDLPAVAYSEDQWTVVAALVRVADRALGALWEVMGRECQADFSEVSLRALGALGDVEGPSDLLLALDRRLSHILVDEFQDTSHLQYLLLERLTEGWVPGDGRTLFLVGDPMQSIYRFREAEVGLFLRAARGGLGQVPLETLTLTANFRSQEGVVEWVNRAFPAVFPSSPDPWCGGVPFSPSRALRSRAAGASVVLRPSLDFDAVEEGREVAETAREARAHGTVAILARSRNHFTEVLRALDRLGLPYQGQDLDPLAQRPAILDLASLTRALLHPGDRLSWLSVLRAPWCGLTLADLHALTRDDPRPIPALLADATRREKLSPEGRALLTRTWSVLDPALAEARRRPLRSWVEGAWTALGAPAYLTAQELGDADTALELIERLDRGGEIRPLHALEERLAGLFASPDPLADPGLQVLTIHKAKGLEFDTVLLPGLGRAPRRDPRRLLYWLETPDEQLLLAPLPPRMAGARDPVADYIRSLDQEKEREERSRVLYVAMTRARERVFLWGHAAVGRDGAVVPEHRSLLENLWPAVREVYQDVVPPSAAEGAAEPPPVRPLRRLSLAWRPPAPAPAVTAPIGAEPVGTAPSPEFDWAGDTARHVGTVAHRLLERIAADGLGAWPATRIAELGPAVRAQLASRGVGAADLDAAAGRTLEAARSALEDPRGRWILAPREGARSEFGLTMATGTSVSARSVDRTFVDEEGTRWIVDFKTSVHEGGQVEAFLDSEVERYRGQLQTYAVYLRALDPGRTVRAALYYPLLRAFREVPV
jgi:ATP-dependent exoDNAse (exonuclease V) beta subunit